MIKIKQENWLSLVPMIVVYAIIFSTATSLLIQDIKIELIVFKILVLIIAIACVSAKNYLVIDLLENTYHEYLGTLGLKFGSKEKFDSIEKIFVNKVNLVTQQFKYGTVVMPNNGEFRNSVYKSFLKFNNGDKILLDSDTNKDHLINRLKEYNKTLQTLLLDTTTHEVVVIE